MAPRDGEQLTLIEVAAGLVILLWLTIALVRGRARTRG
jgi:hypothetical protein